MRTTTRHHEMTRAVIAVALEREGAGSAGVTIKDA